jgi:alkaline phosphatase
MSVRRWRATAVAAALVAAATAAAAARGGFGDQDGDRRFAGRRARNVIFFIGDGMGVSTITARRVFSVGLDGQLVVDQFPHTALSKTYSSDSITPDGAPTMSAMMTGVNTDGRYGCERKGLQARL